MLVQGVGDGDLAGLPAGLVQHLSGLLGQIGHITGVQTDAALGDAQGLQDLVEGPDGVGHAGFQSVVGIHQQSGIVGIHLAVGGEGLQLGVEHLDPGVGHGAAGAHAEELVGDGAGGAVAAADVSGAGTQHGGIGTLGPAGTELQNGTALGGPDNAVGLGGDQALVVDAQQQVGLNELGLDGGSADSDQGLLGKDHGALGHGPDIAGELEILQILQEGLGEEVPRPQVGDVLFGEVQLLDVADDLLQTGRDAEAAAVGATTEEQVEVGDAIFVAVFKVAVCHGQLVEITEHGQVQFAVGIHR